MGDTLLDFNLAMTERVTSLLRPVPLQAPLLCSAKPMNLDEEALNLIRAGHSVNSVITHTHSQRITPQVECHILLTWLMNGPPCEQL